jgi:class 3 adenylate cyclase/tetratricopeptide (TPR) repeat protein
MFCDIVDSTELSQRLDEEDLHAVLRATQKVCVEEVERLGGEIAQLLGDGILVYFGYPQAHEDDTRRAFHCALEIIAALPELNANLRSTLRGWNLRMRVGIHNGFVVVGDVGWGSHHEQLALGDTVNIASRVLEQADPDSIIVTEAARRLSNAEFVFEAIGPKELRGVAQPIELHRLIGAAGSGPKVEARAPLVGRNREAALLRRLMERARSGQGHVVLLSGEAGIGKSRLVQSLKDFVAGSSVLWAELRCSPYHQNAAFYPLIRALKERLGISPEWNLSSEEIRERLLGLLEDEKVDLADALPRIWDFLGLKPDTSHRHPPVSPDARRRQTMSSVEGWLRMTAAQRPVALIAEDLHWADPSTLELLDRLVGMRDSVGVLQVLVSRNGLESRWPEAVGISRIRLGSLGRREARALIEGLVGEARPSARLTELIVSGSDGIPLFIEELTRSVLENQAAGDGTSFRVPTTLQGSLMARLDRLGELKELAQSASVLGREVSVGLLSAVSSRSKSVLCPALDELVERGILCAASEDAGSDYRFRHALIQETAYASLLRRERRRLHARTVDVLQEKFPERVRDDPEVMAHHCERAKRFDAAIRQHLRAGEMAMHRSAHQEALTVLERGLVLIPKLPEGPERNELELALHVALGAPIASNRGYGHPDLERSHLRARELSKEVGEGPPLYQAVGMLYLYHAAHADMKRACDLSAQLVELGVRNSEPFVECFGEAFSSVSAFFEGRFRDALGHLDRMLALEARCTGRPDWFLHEHDPAVVSRSYRGMTLAVMGQLDEAAALASDAIEHGRGTAEPLNVAFALAYAGIVHQLRDEPGEVMPLVQEGIEICRDQGFLEYEALSGMLRGWARARLGSPAEGVAELMQGMSLGSETGTVIEGPRACGYLADAQSRMGDLPRALETVERGLALANRHGNTYWNAELLRLKGEIWLQHDPTARKEVAATLAQACQLAHDQGALLIENRIHASLEDHKLI